MLELLVLDHWRAVYLLGAARCTDPWYALFANAHFGRSITARHHERSSLGLTARWLAEAAREGVFFIVHLHRQESELRRLQHGVRRSRRATSSSTPIASSASRADARPAARPRRRHAARLRVATATAADTAAVAIATVPARCSRPPATAVARKLAFRSARPAPSPSTAATASAARLEALRTDATRWPQPPGRSLSAALSRTRRTAQPTDSACSLTFRTAEHRRADRCQPRSAHARSRPRRRRGARPRRAAPLKRADTPGPHRSPRG